MWFLSLLIKNTVFSIITVASVLKLNKNNTELSEDISLRCITGKGCHRHAKLGYTSQKAFCASNAFDEKLLPCSSKIL